MSRQSVVLLGITAIFAAMLGRMGWIDWLQLLGTAGLVAGAILALLVGAAVFIALPVFLLWTILRAVAGRVLPSKLKASTPSPAR